VDEVRIFVAPKLVGGKQAPGAISGRGVTRMKDALDIEGARWERLGTDMVLRGRVGEWDWMDG
jgi:diaminohydroxyphosphoribosylaminopyrimidine deaminase/5-amino-6-(5-phosphoribosylamino)uracil reductase